MDSRLFDARAWLIWVATAAATTMLTRNPLYTVIILLGSRVVDEVCAGEESDLQLPLARLAVLILFFSSAFNALFVHRGQTVILRLPGGWPLIGGPITAEAASYGAESGLILLTLLAVFLAFNRIVPVSDLARLAPRAFQDLAVVVLIALTYVPETGRHMQRIREAQAVRGHRLQGIGDWRPLVVPLLIGSLERAMSLAEAMVARGYGASQGEWQSSRTSGGLALALGLVLIGWVTALWWGYPGWLLAVAGVGLLLFLIWGNGRQIHTTRYRQEPWRGRDSIVVIAALLPLLLVLLPLPFVSAASLHYSPYPRLGMPSFDPILGLALLLYVTPAALAFRAAPPKQEESYDND